jgi:hypothetical protein
MEVNMNSLVRRPAKVAVSAALLAGILFALPIKMDAQHPLGFSAAQASSRHDSADPYNNNTDMAGHEQNQDPQYNGK